MNAQLAQQMQTVNHIVNEAYPFFEHAAVMRVDADIAAAKALKTRKIISIAAVVMALSLGPIGLVVALAGGVFLFWDYRDRFTQEVETHRQEAYEQADAEQKKGEAIFEAHDAEVSIIPGEYCYPIATEYLAKITTAGRVDSVNEALLMLDEQLHRWSVEEANAAIVAEQQSQSASLKGIRRSNAVSAVANVTNTLFNIANSI